MDYHHPGALADAGAGKPKPVLDEDAAEDVWTVRYPCLSEHASAVDVVGFRMASGQPPYNMPVHTHEKLIPHALKLCRLASRLPKDDDERAGHIRDAAFILERMVRSKPRKTEVAHTAMRYIMIDGNPAHQHTATAMLALAHLSAQDCPGGNPQWAALMADIIAFAPPPEAEDHVLTPLTALNIAPTSDAPLDAALKSARARAQEVFERTGPDGELTMGLSRRMYDHIRKHWANHGCFDMSLRRLTAFIALFMELIRLSQSLMDDFDVATYEHLRHLTAVTSAMSTALPREGAAYKPPPQVGEDTDQWDFAAKKTIGILMVDDSVDSIFFGNDMGDSNMIQGMIDTVADVLPPHTRFLAYVISRCTTYMRLDFALLPLFNALPREYDTGRMEAQQALLRRVRAYRSYGLSEGVDAMQLDPFLKAYCTPKSTSGAGVQLLASVHDDRAVLCGGTEPLAGWCDLVDPFLDLMGDSVPAFLVDLFNRMVQVAAALLVSGTSNIDATATADMFGVLCSIGVFVSCSPDMVQLEPAPRSVFEARRCKVRQLSARRKTRSFRPGGLVGRGGGRGGGRIRRPQVPAPSARAIAYQTDVRELVERYDKLKQSRSHGPTAEDMRFIAEREKGFKSIHRQLHGCTDDPRELRAMRGWSVWPVVLTEADYTVGSLVPTTFVLPDSVSTEVCFIPAGCLTHASHAIARLQHRPLVLAVCARALSPAADSADDKATIEIVVIPTTLPHEAASMPLVPSDRIDTSHPLQRWAASAHRYVKKLRPARSTTPMRPVQMKHLPALTRAVVQPAILQPAFRHTGGNARDLAGLWEVDGLAPKLGFSLVVPPCTSADYVAPSVAETKPPPVRPPDLAAESKDGDGESSLGSFFDAVDGVVPTYTTFEPKAGLGLGGGGEGEGDDAFVDDALDPLQESFGVVLGLAETRRREAAAEKRARARAAGGGVEEHKSDSPPPPSRSAAQDEHGRAFDRAVARAAVPVRDLPRRVASLRSLDGGSVASGGRKRGALPPPHSLVGYGDDDDDDDDDDKVDGQSMGSAMKRRRGMGGGDATSIITASTMASTVAKLRRRLTKELATEDLSSADLRLRCLQVLAEIPKTTLTRTVSAQAPAKLRADITTEPQVPVAIVAGLISFLSSKSFINRVRSKKRFTKSKLYKVFTQMQPDVNMPLDVDDVRVWLLRGVLPCPAEEAPN